MTVKEVIKKLKKMPQDIPVVVESYNTDVKRWGNHDIDFISHHYHEGGINECVIMLNYNNPKYGIMKDNGEYMTDDEMKTYFLKLGMKNIKFAPLEDKNCFSLDKVNFLTTKSGLEPNKEILEKLWK